MDSSGDRVRVQKDCVAKVETHSCVVLEDQTAPTIVCTAWAALGAQHQQKPQRETPDHPRKARLTRGVLSLIIWLVYSVCNDGDCGRCPAVTAGGSAATGAVDDAHGAVGT
eukprot:1723164-Amphidinium_carterae.1